MTENVPFDLYNSLLDSVLLLNVKLGEQQSIRDELFTAMWRTDNPEQSLHYVAAKYELALPVSGIDIDAILARDSDWGDNDDA